MADLKIRIKGDSKGAETALGRVNTKLKAVGSGFKKFAASAKGLFLGAIIGAVTALSVKITKLGAQFEQTSVSFQTMLGNAKLATDLLNDLTAFSTKTPFEPREIYQSAKTLLAFGITAKEVVGVISTIGDVSAATGKDLNELSRIYGKVFVKGKMQAEELNQLSEAGIPIIKELEKMYGKTGAEIFKMGSQGKLTFEDLNNALRSMTAEGGIFFEAMLAQSQTLNGKVSTLKGNFDLLLISFSKLDMVKLSVDKLNESLKDTNALVLQIKNNQVNVDTLIDDVSDFYLGDRFLTERDKRERSKVFSGPITGAELRTARQNEKARKEAEKEAARIKAETDARLKAQQDALNVIQSPTPRFDSLRTIGGGISPLASSARSDELNELQKQTAELEALREELIASRRTLGTYTGPVFKEGS